MRSTDVPGLTQAKARLTGLLYLGTIVGGLFAEVASRGRVRADPATLIAQHETLYRLGEAADLVMLCCYVTVTALFYALFAPGQRLLSLTAACFSLIGIAVLATAGGFHMLPLSPVAGSGTGALALDLHGRLYNVSLVFFGVYCALLGKLFLSSRLIPAVVGWLMVAGGLTHLFTKLAWVAAPQMLDAIPGALKMLPLLGEAALAVWLTAFGVRERGGA